MHILRQLQQIMDHNPEKCRELGQKPHRVARNTPSMGSDSDSGLGGLKRAVGVLGNRAVDRRTTVGKALAGRRDGLIGEVSATARQIPDEHAPWDRQEGESLPAWSAFRCYRDMDRRSLSKVGQELGKSRTLMSRWSARWGWLQRSEQYDAYLDRLVRLKFAQAQVDARERHARLAQVTLTALTAPVRATLEALADPNVIQQLTDKARSGADGTIALLSVIARVAQAMPALVAMERLALRMTTESIKVEDKHDFTFANRIAGDPEATDLAIALLDRLARTGPGTAIGLSKPGELGHLVDGAPPEHRCQQRVVLEQRPVTRLTIEMHRGVATDDGQARRVSSHSGLSARQTTCIHLPSLGRTIEHSHNSFDQTFAARDVECLESVEVGRDTVQQVP